MSFGFKYGVPLDADFVHDMRFLPSPFWVPELRALGQEDAPVADFVFAQAGGGASVEASSPSCSRSSRATSRRGGAT